MGGGGGGVRTLAVYCCMQNFKTFSPMSIFVEILFKKKTNTFLKKIFHVSTMINYKCALHFRSCKLHGVTVHSLLQAAATISVSELLKKIAYQNWAKSDSSKQPKIEPSKLGKVFVQLAPQYARVFPEDSVKAAISERANGVSNDKKDAAFNCGFVVSRSWMLDRFDDISGCLDASPEAVWQLAKHINTSNQEAKRSSLIEFIYLATLLKNSSAEALLSPDYPTAVVHITNHGNCNGLNGDATQGHSMSGLTLESMKVSGLQVYIPLSLDLFGNFITTVDNQLFWSVMFPTNRITQEHARLYTDRALEIAAGSIQE